MFSNGNKPPYTAEEFLDAPYVTPISPERMEAQSALCQGLIESDTILCEEDGKVYFNEGEKTSTLFHRIDGVLHIEVLNADNSIHYVPYVEQQHRDEAYFQKLMKARKQPHFGLHNGGM